MLGLEFTGLRKVRSSATDCFWQGHGLSCNCLAGSDIKLPLAGGNGPSELNCSATGATG
jgi:hypothetical protein